MTEFENDDLAEIFDIEIFRLVTDADGNWYVINVDQKSEFAQWVRDVENGEKDTSEYDFSGGAVDLRKMRFTAYFEEHDQTNTGNM